jgi:hypothetical protein
MNIFSVTILIECNVRKFGCVGAGFIPPSRICPVGADPCVCPFRIVLKIFLINEEP